MGYYHHSDEKFEQIEARLNDMLQILKGKQRTNPEQVFFDTQEFLQIMNISKRTAQYWRDSGLIGYSQIGYKIYYRLSDILKLLTKNYNQPTNGK